MRRWPIPKRVLCALAIGVAAGMPAPAFCQATTPTGAIRAGDAQGIPPWTGQPENLAAIAAESPTLIITAANYTANSARLPEGAVALFRRYPDYTMRIFKSHRTARQPPEIVENIARNASRAHAAPEGIAYGVAGAAGGIPFPSPHNGTEIVWNHLLAFWGAAREAHVETWVASGDGSIEQTAGYREITDFPYYAPGVIPATTGAYYFRTRRLQDAPAARAGEAYIAWQPLNTARDHYVAWRYLPGEHRARKAPSLSYDTPDADAGGYEELDDYYLFFGGPDRYDFRILGKRDMFVPYNNEALNQADPRSLMGPHHANQNAIRYELHRVWEVEAQLAPGKHHVAPHRKFYFDEDTWLATYSEAWDEDGKFWKFGQATMPDMPQIPAVIGGAQFMYDLQQGGYCLDFAFGGRRGYYRVTSPHRADVFNAESLAADSLR